MVSAADIERAARLIQAGELVAFATETVYGLGADALNPEAAAKVFEAKARPSFDPLIVHVSDDDSAWALAASVPEVAKRLAAAFWPGPMTLVLPKRPVVPGIVTAGLDTVGLRVPAHPTALSLLQAAERPIAAPSANRFGGISPTRAHHVKVPCAMVLDGGPCDTGVESTVLRPEPDGSVTLLRPGGLPSEAIEELLGRRLQSPKPGSSLASPGMLERHYAPRTPLILVESFRSAAKTFNGKSIGYLSLRRVEHGSPNMNRILSATGDLVQAAARLFECMHEMDGLGLDLIVAQRVPNQGLGRAINDRLQRAAASSP